jgi:hypothetical protein
MFLMKQAIDKPPGQNLSGKRGEPCSLSFVIAKTQVRKHRLQTEMKEKIENSK